MPLYFLDSSGTLSSFTSSIHFAHFKGFPTHSSPTMHFFTLVSVAILGLNVLAYPKFTRDEVMRAIRRSTHCNDRQRAREFVIPPLPADTSSKKIPGE
jgi:hypothetical protein